MLYGYRPLVNPNDRSSSPDIVVCQSFFTSKKFIRLVYILGSILLFACLLISVRFSEPTPRLVVTYIPVPELDGRRVKETCKERPLEALFFVHTAPQHYRHRRFLRDILDSTVIRSQFNVSTVFFVGSSTDNKMQMEVEKEAEGFGDLVVFPFGDTYRNLTYKFVYGIKWVMDNCPDVKFIVKIDDDAFVNVFGIMEYLRINASSAESELHCLVWRRTIPVRNKVSKWFVTREEYPGRFYPTYCCGLGYMFPAKVVPSLYAASMEEPFLWIDDVYATGVLAKAAGLQHRQLIRHYHLYPNETDPRITEQYFFTHMNSIVLQKRRYELWDELVLNYNPAPTGASSTTGS